MSLIKNDIRFLTSIILVVGLFFVSACYDGSSTLKGKVTGTIALNDPGVASNLARVRIAILDVSLVDAASLKISEIDLAPPEEWPLVFSIDYVLSDIDSSHSYSLFVEVFELHEDGEEKRAYITTQSYPIITQGYGNTTDVWIERIN